MVKQEPRKHHYIPRFILKNFNDDTLANGTCFELYDGPCFIGASTVIEYCEER